MLFKSGSMGDNLSNKSNTVTWWTGMCVFVQAEELNDTVEMRVVTQKALEFDV